MKITMIEPKAPGKHVFSTVKMPRLGLPLLGTILRQAGHQVELILGSRQDIRWSSIIDSDLVAISTTTSTVIEAYHLADYVRSEGIPVAMGGAHVSFMPEEALQHCDYVSRGEADTTFLQLVECIERGELPWKVPGVSFRCGEEVIHNPLPEWVDVNQVPSPDLSMFASLKMSTYPVMTSRGCPFDCTFCSVTSMFGRKHRCRGIDLVLEELQQYKGKQVFFIDDNFTANPRRSKELLTEMIQRDILPSWWCAQVRSDAARDDELLSLMAQSNCGMVFVGMESINPKTLQSFNKKQDVADIIHCIRRFHQHRIMVHGMFVFGGDDDTLATINETVDFAIKHRIDTVQFLVLTPLPGTRTFEGLEREERLLTRDWNLYDAHHVVFQPQLMSAYELQKAVVQGFKKFYSVRQLLGNLSLTGIRSVAFRVVGFWVSRSWEKENRWYYGFLKSLTNPAAMPIFRGSISKTVETYRLRRLKYRTCEQLMEIQVTRQEGQFLVNLKGCLNDFSLQETFHTLSSQLPRCYQNITINMEQVTFASEKLAVDFIQGLNSFAHRAREVHLQMPAARSFLLEVLKKHNLPVPGFSISG